MFATGLPVDFRPQVDFVANAGPWYRISVRMDDHAKYTTNSANSM
jgi:hypothetical protein